MENTLKIHLLNVRNMLHKALYYYGFFVIILHIFLLSILFMFTEHIYFFIGEPGKQIDIKASGKYKSLKKD